MFSYWLDTPLKNQTPHNSVVPEWLSHVVNSSAFVYWIPILCSELEYFSTVIETGAVDMISCTNLDLDYFACRLCLISSLFKPCSHEADTFLELDLCFFLKSNNIIKSAVLCILCFLSELKRVCIMHWLMPPYWKCKQWWHLILRTYWMQETQWRKLKLLAKSKYGAIQSINVPFMGKFWKRYRWKKDIWPIEIVGKLKLEGTSGVPLVQLPVQRRVSYEATPHNFGFSAVWSCKLQFTAIFLVN